MHRSHPHTYQRMAGRLQPNPAILAFFHLSLALAVCARVAAWRVGCPLVRCAWCMPHSFKLCFRLLSLLVRLKFEFGWVGFTCTLKPKQFKPQFDCVFSSVTVTSQSSSPPTPPESKQRKRNEPKVSWEAGLPHAVEIGTLGRRKGAWLGSAERKAAQRSVKHR